MFVFGIVKEKEIASSSPVERTQLPKRDLEHFVAKKPMSKEQLKSVIDELLSGSDD